MSAPSAPGAPTGPGFAGGSAEASAAIRVFVSMLLLYFMSQFFRSTNAVVAPDLRADVGVSAADLGVITGAFFLAYAIMQVPSGVLLDRFGARRTLVTLMGVPALGALVFANAHSVWQLVLGQVLMGAGCACGLMAAIVVFARWFAPDRLATFIALFSGLGNAGIILSATPLAAAVALVGWRWSFVGAAAVTVVLVAQVYLLVRDAPPGHPYHTRTPEPLGAIARGVREVLAERQMRPILALAFVSLGLVLTVRALWGGPYLADVYGLGDIERGNVLLLMTVFMLAGNVGFGPLDRLFDSRKRVVIGGAVLTALTLSALAAPPALSLWQATALLCLLGLVCNYVVVLLAHARGLFPDRLVGRAVTLVNFANFTGIATMQFASGLIVGAFPGANGSAAAEGYRALFGFLALLVVLGLLAYCRVRDVRPSSERGLARS